MTIAPKWVSQTKLAAEYLGFEIVDTKLSKPKHEGWGCHLLQTLNGKYGIRWAVLAWNYGHCAQCDPYHYEIRRDEANYEICYAAFGDDIELCEDETQARLLFDNVGDWIYSSQYCGRYYEFGFSTLSFPILRRVYPALIANEIVSVQPMTVPVAAIFHMNYTYHSNKDKS